MLRLLIRPTLLFVALCVLLTGAAHTVGIVQPYRGILLAFTSNTETGRAHVSLVDFARGARRDLTHRVTQERFAGWSADGTRLAVFQVDQPPIGTQTRTLILDFSTGIVRLYRGSGRYARFSPDGRWLAYTREIDPTTGELWLLDTESGQLSRLSHDLIVSGSPSWTPDSTAVLIGGHGVNQSFQVYRFALDRSPPIAITDYVGNNYDPLPSPDGRWLLFQSAQRRSLSAMVVPLDDASVAPRSITAGDGFCQLPAWSPDSTRVAVICQGVYGRFGRALFMAYVEQGEIDFLAPNVRAMPLQWLTDQPDEAILYTGDDGVLYRIAAPRLPIEGTDQLRPAPQPLRLLYATETYLPLGVRP